MTHADPAFVPAFIEDQPPHGNPEGLDMPEGGQSSGQYEGSPSAASGEQKVSWLELFFDLIFVTSFDQLAKRLGDSFDVLNVLTFVLMFAALWSIWSGNTQFAARFGNQGRIYRWGTLLELITLGALSLSLRGDLEHTGWLFAGAYAFNRLTLAAMHLLEARAQIAAPDGTLQAARYAQQMGYASLAAAALWALSIPLQSDLTLVAWGAALLVTLFAPVWLRQQHHLALPHHEHLPERVGLLQIIALGGIVTEAVIGGRQQELTVAGQLPTLLALLTCIGLWRLYFDQSRALPVVVSNMQRKGSTLMLWLYAHMPLTIAIMMVGVGFGHGIAYEDEHHDLLNLTLVSWSLTAVFLSLAFIRWNAARHTLLPTFDRSMWALLAGAALSAVLAVTHLDTTPLHFATAAVVLGAALITATDPSSKRLAAIEEKMIEQQGE